MTDKIGPTFPSELTTAAVSLDGIAWDPVAGTLIFGAGVLSGTKTAAAAVLAAHDPSKITPDMELANRLAAGIAITSTITNTLDGTYALDKATLNDIEILAIKCAIETLKASGNSGFPSNVSTFQYPKLDGTIGATGFTPAQIEALNTAMTNLVTGLYEETAVLKAGQTPTWPAQSGTVP